jgi:avidin family protein
VSHKHDVVSGTWHNEQGSELRIEVGPEGRVIGRFGTAVGFGVGESFEVTGFLAGTLIVFAVNFGKYGSLTSWVGHVVDDGEPALRTLWQMTVESPHPKESTELWKTIWSGANTFRRGSAPALRDGTRRAPPMPLWMG